MNVDGESVIDIDKEADKVIIPANAKYIGAKACLEGKITYLDLEHTYITIIGKSSFKFCNKLQNVLFPSSLEEICARAFAYCSELKFIKFPSDSKLRKIGDEAFLGCCHLRQIDFPPLLEVIGKKIVNYCERIDLSHTKVTKIGENAFGDYIGLTIMLPATVSIASISNSLNNFWQTRLIVDDNHPLVKSDDKILYVNKEILYANKEKSHFLIRRGTERIMKFCFACSNLVSLTIPASVIKICKSAFSKCENLQWIRFSKNSRLEEIQHDAFRCCKTLKNLIFPKSLKRIGKNAFKDCYKLEKVSFPKDSLLESIKSPFSCCPIKNISLPRSIRDFEGLFYGMFHLESVSVSNDIYESNLEKTAIFSKDRSELICVVPAMEHFEIPNCVRVIKKGAFYCASINQHLFIPKSVEIIEDHAFMAVTH